MDITCYAYEYEPPASSGKPCAGCGRYYWEHSHYLSERRPRPRRVIISKYDAMALYDWHHATREPFPDDRPRYQMMMDRTPGICAWMQVRMVREAAKHLLRDTLPGSTTVYAGGVIPDAELQARAEAMAGIVHPAAFAPGGPQTEPIEVTTWQNMMNRTRRWILPDGTTHIETTHYPENTP